MPKVTPLDGANSNRREFLKRLGAGAGAAAAWSIGGCLPHVEGSWSSCSGSELGGDGGVTAPKATAPVVEVHRPGVIVQNAPLTLDEAAVRDMLERGLLALTGAPTSLDAWRILLPNRAAGERIGIKVNTLNRTVVSSPALVKAVAQSLIDSGVAQADILVWDRFQSELNRSGLTEAALGVACQGTLSKPGSSEGPGYELQPTCLSGRKIYLSSLLESCAHLINLSVMKNHFLSGFTGCLKNHYGTFSDPGSFHTDCHLHIARLNALPAIVSRTRLCIMDALVGVASGDTDAPADCTPERILLSLDPVAIDRRGLGLRDLELDNIGQPKGFPAPCLDQASQLGIGALGYQLISV